MNWYDNAIIYHIYPLGFCGAPKFNDGGEVVYRLDKVLEWIPHFKEMNVDAVYFGPVFESVEHGYDTTDYKMIDRRLGDNNSFKHICDELHANNIRVILDGVFNHVGRKFPQFVDIQEKGQGSGYCDWFQNLKVQHLGNNNPRIHTDETLIALSICANTDPNAKKAMEQLSKLRGCEVHSTVILSQVDERTFKRLGINLTCEPKYQA